MYAEHQSQIQCYAYQGPNKLANVCRFVLATIRTSFPDAIEAYRDYVITGTRQSVAFFGGKYNGLDWVDENKEQLFDSWINIGGPSDETMANQLVDLFTHIPNIGLVKAGFLAQLTRGVSGCIDTHNLSRFGKAYGEVRFNKNALYGRRLKRIKHYNRVVSELGGTERLWNEWCEYVSRVQGYGTPEQVSAMHLKVII